MKIKLTCNFGETFYHLENIMTTFSFLGELKLKLSSRNKQMNG